VALLTFLAAPAEAQQVPAPSTPPIAFTHLQVVDVVTGAITPGQTVIVREGRIQAVGPDRAVPLPAGATVIDGANQYVLPGLWDMHVHTAAIPMRPPAGGRKWSVEANGDYVFPLFIANGITGVRDMSGDLAVLRQWRGEVAAGRRLGPRLVITGWKFGSEKPVVAGAPYPIRTAADVRESVRMLKANGADFVKYLVLPPELTGVLFEASREAGLPVSGHVPGFLSSSDVADYGIKSVEHMNGVLLAGSSRRAEVAAHALHEYTWWGRLLIWLGVWDIEAREIDRRRMLVDGYTEAPPREVFQHLIEHGTWETPTLSAIRKVHGLRDPDVDLQHRSAYVLPFLTKRLAGYPGGDSLLAQRYVRIQFELVGLMAKEGVPLLAGSDMPGTHRLPGFSLVDELEYLVRAGLTPLQAVRAATYGPATYLGARDSMGTVAEGKVADLLLLDANPLEDITNLRHVQGVVAAGRYLPRSDLDSLLSGVARLVSDWKAAAQGDAPSSLAAPGNNH
jgi:imidazolonepropionase-like amidohydrolase